MTTPTKTIIMSKGQNSALEQARAVFTAEVAAPYELSALLVTSAGKVRSDADFIFYNQPEAPGVAVKEDGGWRIMLDCDQIPADVDEVRVVVSLEGQGTNFRSLPSPVVCLSDESGSVLVRYTIDGLEAEAVVIALEVYRRQGAWKVRAVGQGYGGGLAHLIADHGVRIAEEAPAAPPAPAPVSPPPTPAAPRVEQAPPPQRRGTTTSTPPQQPVSRPAGAFVDFYSLLQIAETADDKKIRDAVRNERRTWQKRAGGSDPVKRALAEQRVRDISDAERVLLDPNQRKQFDQRKRNHRPEEAPTSSAGGQDWLVRAHEFFARGDAASAHYAAREAIALNGANHEAWAIRANSSFLMNDFKDAGFEFREAIRLKPDNPEYHFDYAEAFMGTGGTQEALAEYEAALRLAPGNPMYRTAIANVYIVTEKSAKALEIMESVVRENPGNPVLQYYLALALHDVTLDKWSLMRNGSYIITSQAQIDVTRQMTNRALSLTFDDQVLRAGLQKHLDAANEAERVRMVMSPNIKVYLFFAFVGLMGTIFAKGAGLLMLIPTILIYVYFNRIPGWKLNKRHAAIARAGI